MCRGGSSQGGNDDCGPGGHDDHDDLGELDGYDYYGPGGHDDHDGHDGYSYNFRLHNIEFKLFCAQTTSQ